MYGLKNFVILLTIVGLMQIPLARRGPLIRLKPSVRFITMRVKMSIGAALVPIPRMKIGIRRDVLGGEITVRPVTRS